MGAYIAANELTDTNMQNAVVDNIRKESAFMVCGLRFVPM